jgi:hypothetical protein
MVNAWKRKLLTQLTKKEKRASRYSDEESTTDKEDVEALKRLRDSRYTRRH